MKWKANSVFKDALTTETLSGVIFFFECFLSTIFPSEIDQNGDGSDLARSAPAPTARKALGLDDILGPHIALGFRVSPLFAMES